MSQGKKEKKGRRGLFILTCIGVFIICFAASAAVKLVYNPLASQYSVSWSEEIGSVATNLAYGEGEAQTFDLYLPADDSKKNYGLVVYLHAGGFTTGDKADDKEILQWLTSKGYVAVGINYTLFGEDNPDANIYTQSLEIREAMPVVIEEANKRGYTIDKMAVAGGSAGHTLAMLYAYRDADQAPVPITMVFGAVGPSSFYPQDWTSYGFDKDTAETNQAAAALFSGMSGQTITPQMFGTHAYDEAVKDISALSWIDEHTVPTVMAYGKYDKFQPYLASVRLDQALTDNNVPHDYFVLEHSGHGLQNDSKVYKQYMETVVDYLNTYLPID